MAKTNSNYIPALNQPWLAPFYDPLLRYVMREETFKKRLIALAKPQPGERILDLGCGTGTLTLMIQKAQPAAQITGVDGDPSILQVARQKADKEYMSAIRWDYGLADNLPYSDAAFDLVVSCLVFHHLTPEGKQRACHEVFRVLKPGGRFLIADFGPAHDPLMRVVTLWMARLERTADNFSGQIPKYITHAGFDQVSEPEFLRSVFGPLSLYEAHRPAQMEILYEGLLI